MTDFKFALPVVADQKAIQEGVFFDVTDSKGVHWAKFKLRHLNDKSREGIRTLLKVSMKFEKRSREAGDDALKKFDVDFDSSLHLLTDLLLTDWKDVKDADGNEVPFSKEAAKAYFAQSATNWMVPQLIELASNPANYETEIDVEEVAGN
ncbi:hypothetical protein [Brevundimonas olei]|uniref:hypothetical protein n=1 Tax=Brevundimonas olei TaxID=657642 RepID=UPI0031CE2F7F